MTPPTIRQSLDMVMGVLAGAFVSFARVEVLVGCMIGAGLFFLSWAIPRFTFWWEK